MMVILNVIIYLVVFMFLLLGLFFGGILEYYNNFYNIILNGYNKDCRFVKVQSMVIYVFLFFYLKLIVDFDEVLSKLVMVGFFIIIWEDENIKWNFDEYGNIILLYIDELLVWKLFMVFFNIMLINVGLFGFK